MKKSILCVSASVLLGVMVLFQACKEDDPAQQPENLTIELLTPDATAMVTPDDCPLSFSWKKTAGTGATTLYISVDATFPEGAKTFKHEAGDGLTYSLSEADYELLLAGGGVSYGAQVTVHWKVEAANATPGTSSFIAYRRAQPVIILMPGEATLNANELTEAPTFEWITVSEVTAYTVKFSIDETFSAGNTKTYDVGNESSYTFASVDAFDQMLQELGITAQGMVYWTATPTTENAVVRPAIPRSFTAVRISRLVTPYDAPMIVTTDLTGNFTLEWMPVQGVTSYDVVVARNEGLTDVVTTISRTVSNANTLSIAWADIQAMIENPANNYKRYKKNTLYWNVKASGNFIAEAPGRIKLYGQRIFVDNRAEWAKTVYTIVWGDHNPDAAVMLEPERTYKVTVVEYNGKEVVWLAEDLQATCSFNEWASGKLWEGEWPAARTPSEREQYEANETGCLKAALPTAYLNRTDPPVGVYYDNISSDNILPRGLTLGQNAHTTIWRVPTANEWAELFTAAVNTYGDDAALRHPNFTTSDHANAWGMNMLGNGNFTYGGDGGCGTRQQWSENDIYYLTATSTGNAYKWNGNSGEELSDRNGNNIRAIYTGDGE
jgi:hypothetical protein